MRVAANPAGPKSESGWRCTIAFVTASASSRIWSFSQQIKNEEPPPAPVELHSDPSISWFEKRLADGPVPPPTYRPYYFPNALGALLIRAGRIDEAIARLNEGIAAAKEAKFADYPTDWAYLALAHAREGNVAESRRWLERLRGFRPASTVTFWDLQELALLQSEAESLLFDSEFPTDPFQGPRPR
jgi:hypothetical protein